MYLHTPEKQPLRFTLCDAQYKKSGAFKNKSYYSRQKKNQCNQMIFIKGKQGEDRPRFVDMDATPIDRKVGNVDDVKVEGAHLSHNEGKQKCKVCQDARQ